MTNHPPRKGRCGTCGQTFSLRVDGTVRGHGWRNLSDGRWCPGSWSPPTAPLDPPSTVLGAMLDATLRSPVTREGEADG